ncbi:hypothetical protein LTR78_009673 [Recurvomyces mirabilis]|uniref:Uncharacterized protein n=1 Tax=Recurvomyces mirabilis TaxID=574656 RepID=A0AAE0WII4_9PEZI|nr:hypothetical protein LTR78_009673 [Recurvomyces mirabilis]KAK5150285.1 hypothetical protein LTS14_010262 [Recurvomyces mirabilis]
MAAASELWMALKELGWRKLEQLGEKEDWEVPKDHQSAIEESEDEDDSMWV